MYQCGDRVMYGIHGACTVISIEERDVDRKRVEYYILEPVDQCGTRYMVPTQNPAAVAKMRKLMARSELEKIMFSSEVRVDIWITDENLRKQHYRELLNQADRMNLLRMIYTLHRYKNQQRKAGKKLHACDENFLRDAEKILNAEIALILNIPQNQAAQYVKNALNIE